MLHALVCRRCDNDFDCDTVRGYCDLCVSFFRSVKDQVHKAQNPHPQVHCVGKFTKTQCPQSFTDPENEDTPICGLCGSDELQNGYGFAGGYGLGSYAFCCGCNTILDFREDAE